MTRVWKRSRGVAKPVLLTAFAAGAVVVGLVVTWNLWPDELEIRKISRPESELIARSEQLIPSRPPPGGYVGSKVCAKCHAAICESYQTHPMAHASSPISQTTLAKNDIKDFSFSTPQGRTYQVKIKGDAVWHHELMTDTSGKTIYDQKIPIHYQIGVGKRRQSYLTNRDGLLFLSPIVWNSTQEQWEESKGGSVFRFEGRATDACVNCHVGRLAVNKNAKDHFHEPVILEGGISCERCHGPAKIHVMYHSSEVKGLRKDTIVNPRHLKPEQRESVCNQCHLMAEERILRFGRTEYDFRPGMNLSDVWVVFASGLHGGAEHKKKSHVQQMRASICYQKSRGRLGCTSCHDPHLSPGDEERLSFYRSKCVACHQPDKSACVLPLADRQKSPALNSCIHCHMPEMSSSAVPHTPKTDHRILRWPNQKKRRVRLRNLAIFDGEKQLPPLEVRRARGLATIMQAESDNSGVLAARTLELLLPVLKVAGDDVETIEAAGTACHIQKRFDTARQYWEQGLQIIPQNESILERLGLLGQEVGALESGIKYLDRLFAINPWRAELYCRHAEMLATLKQLDRAVESAKRCLELNPSRFATYQMLIDMYQWLEDTEKSQYYRDLFGKFSSAPNP